MCVCFGEMHFQCSEDKYVTSAYQWMVPFLHRCEKQSPGVANELLKEYLVTLAKGDLISTRILETLCQGLDSFSDLISSDFINFSKSQ